MNEAELLRYSRHIMLPEIDYAGQQRLCDARVLLVGLGGLGSPAAMYLTAAGVGTLYICDFDHVELSNLPRQPLYTSANLGQSKVAAATTLLNKLNSNTNIVALYQKCTEDIVTTVEKVDVVLDCSDNLTTRFALNRACVQMKKPLVSGAAIRFEGQLGVFRGYLPDAPCYQCLYRDTRELETTCVTAGVLGPVVGTMGSLQALEAIKLLVGLPTLENTLQMWDGLRMTWDNLQLRKNPRCEVCGSH